MDHAFGVVSEHHTQGHLGFLLCSVLGVYNFVFYIYVYDLSGADFVKDVRSLSRLIFFLFALGCSLVLAPFVKNTSFAPLYCIHSFVKDQLTTIVN